MVNETLCAKKYSIPDPGSHSRRLVNGRSQSPGHHGTTSPLVLSTHHQRPHPHAGPEDSVSPLTRLVSRAWYGIRHLTTPLRSIHLPVESPRKVGALESPLQLTRPHGWHSGALGSPQPVRGQRRHRRPHRRQVKGGSDGESGIWVSVGHQQMDTEPYKQASLPTETQR